MGRASTLALLALGTMFVTPPLSAAPRCPNTVEVAVLRDGQVVMDGKRSTLATLDAKFAALSATNGLVWYFDEARPGDPGWVTGEAVMNKVTAHQLWMSFSSGPDFSQILPLVDGAPGTPEPRTDCS